MQAHCVSIHEKTTERERESEALSLLEERSLLLMKALSFYNFLSPMQVIALLIVSIALHANAIAAFQFNATTCVQLGPGCVFEPVTRQCICSNTAPSDEPIPSSTAAPPVTSTTRPTIAPSSSLPPS
ncbi:hypothetical protein AC1031_010724 [Aphanomyces cochlioides]|nr:hypothetical protein AC1031_010724 [Aphanomyces cochlioides]